MSAEPKSLSNHFRVGVTGKQKVSIGAVGSLPYGISPDDALLLAAWLVALAQPFATVQFDDVVKEVQR